MECDRPAGPPESGAHRQRGPGAVRHRPGSNQQSAKADDAVKKPFQWDLAGGKVQNGPEAATTPAR